MNAFSLTGANDYVRECSTIRENKHGVGLAGLTLPFAHVAYLCVVSDLTYCFMLVPRHGTVPDRSYRFIPPSKLPLTGMAAAEVTAPDEAGNVVVKPVGVARLSRTAFVVLVAKLVMPSSVSSS